GLEAGCTDCSRYVHGTLRLDQVKMVVLDEADEMLDMGFRDDIEQVLNTVPTGRQFICFSATMAKAIMDLITLLQPDGRYMVRSLEPLEFSREDSHQKIAQMCWESFEPTIRQRFQTSSVVIRCRLCHP